MCHLAHGETVWRSWKYLRTYDVRRTVFSIMKFNVSKSMKEQFRARVPPEIDPVAFRGAGGIIQYRKPNMSGKKS